MWPFQRIMVKLGRNFLKCPENSSGCESAKNLSVKVFVMEKPENNQKCSSIWDWFSQLSVSILFKGFPGGSAGRESACNAGDLGWEDPLEKGTATHFSILAWRIPSTEKPGMLRSMGSQKVRQDWATFTFMNERWAWVNIYFCLRGFILGLQEKIAAQAQKKRRQKASENSWYLFPCQTLCINFSLLQRRGCLQEPRVRHGA